MSSSPEEHQPTYRSNHSRITEDRTFELGALSTEGIKRLGHAVGLERRERLNRSDLHRSEALMDLLGAAFRREVVALPQDEAKELVRDLAADESPHVRGLAMYGVTALIGYDWQFVRDTMIDLSFHPDGEGYMQTLFMRQEMRETATPEQVADYSARYRARWNEAHPLLRRDDPPPQ